MSALRLSSLTIEGFKSFAGRVELPFPGVLIAIVGPNGVGKSNICDAIAWVLGEQSARLLRSQTMSDVIFAGSPDRPALGAAEVLLSLTTRDGRWSESGGALEISRRVFRDGTSEYRLQGRRVRLKDVMDSLFDAGLGTRAYAIIEQGRIGQVLSMRANERRALFEEAAGISKFRVRRHEAELKLAETRANLLRVNDITGEVRRALEAARRQARRAERHYELRQLLLQTRASVFASRRLALATEAERREAETASASEREAEAAARLAAAEAKLASERRALDVVQERLADAHRLLGQVDLAAQRRDAEEAANRREVEEAIARRDAAALNASRLASELSGLEAQSEEQAAAVEAATLRHSEVAAEAQNSRTALETAEAEASATTAAAESSRRDLLAAVAAAGETRHRVHRLEVEEEQTAFQRKRLAAEAERLRTHLAAAAQAEEEASARLRTSEAAAGASEENRRKLRFSLDALLARAAVASGERDRVAHARWQAHHERAGLQRQLASARALPQALARLLPDEAVLGTVADFLDPPGELAPLLDRAWGELLSLPVVRDREAGSVLLERARDHTGTLEVVVADRSLLPRPSPLLESAGAHAEDLPWLSHALPRAVVAENATAAEEIARKDPDLIVLVADRGRLRGARVAVTGSRVAAPGVLELRIRERSAARAEDEAATAEAAITEELASLQQQQNAVQAELAVAEEASREAAEASAAASSTYETHHRERLRLQREEEVLAEESARLERESVSLAQRLAVAREEAERLGTRASELELAVDEATRKAQHCRDLAATRSAETERMMGHVAVAAERLTAARRELERSGRDRHELQARITAAKQEHEEQGKRADTATEEAARARDDLARLLAQRTQATRSVEVLTGEEAGAREAVATAENEAEQMRGLHLSSRDDQHKAELQLTEAKGELEKLAEAIALTIGADTELPSEPPSEAQLPALEQSVERLSEELAALGPVNELAVTERDSLEERHRFLRVQRRDLERSLDSLADTIRELDTTCASRFVGTLEEASRSFGEVFRILFGGGDASVELSDPDSPLDAGVEIRVRPPGKHTQSVLLLSGGEKALAAIALLLALFRIHPAPFCVLDEVDAPLDDANVERLCRLLRDMSRDTQFLLVTHNRRTMAHADVLYGVTMEEPGVSRIVSVRLEE